jgi:hypothetical protein
MIMYFPSAGALPVPTLALLNGLPPPVRFTARTPHVRSRVCPQISGPALSSASPLDGGPVRSRRADQPNPAPANANAPHSQHEHGDHGKRRFVRADGVVLNHNGNP